MEGRVRGRGLGAAASRSTRALGAAALIALALAPSAWAHARLVGTSPPPGAVEKREPRLLVLHFDEPLEGRLDTLRVLDAQGRRIDDGQVVGPGRSPTDLGVRLLPGAGKGTYRVSYRIVSEDGHVVTGATAFSVGHPTTSRMAGGRHAGAATETAFGIARGATYLATALVVGLLAFLWVVWLPSLDSTAAGAPAWADASGAFATRVRRILYASIELGVLAGVAALALEGATATGSSFWSALDDHVFRDVTHTQFGGYWAFRLVDFMTLGAVLVLAGRGTVVPQLRRAALGATGIAMTKAGPRMLLTVALPAVILVLTPALAGHAADRQPGLMVPVDAIHVLAMSAWLGGLVALVAAVPAATRLLPARDGQRLLAAVVVRFSGVALACVILLVASGAVQALVHVGSWSALLDTGYGRAVLAKIAITLVLVGLGAANRRRAVPELSRLARGDEIDAAPARLLRRAVAAEVALIVVVLGVTSALVSYAPPGG